MNLEDFNKVVSDRLSLIESVLIKKGKEYSSDTDRLHNFKVASCVNNESPESALWGMATKHLVSIMDLINTADDSHDGKFDCFDYSPALVEEKIGDMINYLILLEALFKERIRDRMTIPLKED